MDNAVNIENIIDLMVIISFDYLSKNKVVDKRKRIIE
jgi:hypothetical protein